VANLEGSVFGLLGLAVVLLVVLGLIVSSDRCAVVPHDVTTMMPDESATMLNCGKPHAHSALQDIEWPTECTRKGAGCPRSPEQPALAVPPSTPSSAERGQINRLACGPRCESTFNIREIERL
jgi:hypothetical protein